MGPNICQKLLQYPFSSKTNWRCNAGTEQFHTFKYLIKKNHTPTSKSSKFVETYEFEQCAHAFRKYR